MSLNILCKPTLQLWSKGVTCLLNFLQEENSTLAAAVSGRRQSTKKTCPFLRQSFPSDERGAALLKVETFRFYNAL